MFIDTALVNLSGASIKHSILAHPMPEAALSPQYYVFFDHFLMAVISHRALFLEVLDPLKYRIFETRNHLTFNQ